VNRFLVVIEKADNNYSAYSPDLPGCVATGKTPQEVRENMAEAIKIHIKGLKEDGLPIPVPTAEADYIGINLQAL
jgi:predicted RNase H-like HicB family nuclease